MKADMDAVRSADNSQAYRDIHGFDFDDERAAAACSRWKRPPRGGLGLAAIAAFFRRSALWIGVSGGDFESSVMAVPGLAAAVTPHIGFAEG